MVQEGAAKGDGRFAMRGPFLLEGDLSKALRVIVINVYNECSGSCSK